jgi:hypothetical protein
MRLNFGSSTRSALNPAYRAVQHRYYNSVLKHAATKGRPELALVHVSKPAILITRPTTFIYTVNSERQGAESSMESGSLPPNADSPTPLSPPDNVAELSLPTHHLENIKAGKHSVQLLVSTQNHLYKATDVEAGEDSWQVIGSWSDDSVSELTQILGQRSPTHSPAPSTAQSRFGGGYGAGKTLGTNSKHNSDAAK